MGLPNFNKRWLHRTLQITFVISGLMVCVFAGYVIYLDRLISSTFEGRRWSVPSHVFAQALELYPGLALTQNDLLLELHRLGYVEKSGELPVGSFAKDVSETQGTHSVLVHIRKFDFLDQTRPPALIRVRFHRGSISALTDPFNHPLSLLRLDPPLIGSIFRGHGEDRIILPPQQTPELLLQALKVVEDRNFDQHPGFDLSAIARAFWVNLSSGSVRQGGSTLTQQLVKSFFLDNRRTLGRKLKELIMAIILDARFAKADLLNAYINEIYLGQDGDRAIHGFGLASEFYFNKPLSELRIDEIALLIAIIRGPSYYNPFRHPERAMARRDLVLSQMQQFALISTAQYKQALKFRIELAGDVRRGGSYYPAFMDLVRSQLAEDYPDEQLMAQGLRVFTTLNPRIQEAAEAAGVEALHRIEQSRNLPEGQLQLATIVASTQTGEIQAMVGGRIAGFQGFNRALNARRPIGSLLKPVIYLTALEQKDRNMASLLQDTPIEVEDPDSGEIWSPQNFDTRFQGPVPMVRALGDSLNLATVHLGMQLGVENVAHRIASLLQRPPPPAYPSLLLGALDLSPLEVAKLYSIFSGGGFYSPLKTVVAVIDENNEVLSRYPIKVQQLADPLSVTQLEYALMAVMQFGTGRRSPFARSGVAGKTGSSDDLRDSWFAGFDDQHLGVVWVGYDDNRSTGLTGSVGALPVWNGLMQKLKVFPVAISTNPKLEIVTLDYETGELANASCSHKLVTLAVPSDARLTRKNGCGGNLRDLGNRLKRWLNQ